MKTFESFDQLLEVVRAERPKAGFSATVSNPPYQLSAGESASWSSAIYHQFMLVSQQISGLVSMVYPSRWRNGGVGEGLDAFREKELASKHYLRFYEVDGKVLFPTSDTGFLNYFLWSQEKSDDTDYYFEGVHRLVGNLSIGADIINPKYLSIRNKFEVNDSLTDRVRGQTYYGVNTDGQSQMQSFLDPDGELVIYRPKAVGSGIETVTARKEITNTEVNDYKVFASVTAHSDKSTLVSRHDRIFAVGPNAIRGRAFINIGSFSSREESINCLYYLKTTLVSFLIGIRLPNHIVAPDRYSLVPNVNFATGEILDKPGTFLDFSSPETLDDQLAVIYNLTEDERNLMTKDLKPWKDKTSVTADM